MSTIFDNIITGVWPGRFVWADDLCVAFATIEPTSPGHVLVVPRTAYDAWTDAPSDVAAHLMTVARTIGLAQKAAFGVPRAGLAIAGFEVPHTHLHVIPLRDETDILLSKAAPATRNSTARSRRCARRSCPPVTVDTCPRQWDQQPSPEDCAPPPVRPERALPARPAASVRWAGSFPGLANGKSGECRCGLVPDDDVRGLGGVKEEHLPVVKEDRDAV